MKIYFKINLSIIERIRILYLFYESKWHMKASFGSSLLAA